MGRCRQKALSAFLDHLVLACVDEGHGEHRARFVYEQEKAGAKGKPATREIRFRFPAMAKADAIGQLRAWVEDLLTGDHAVLLPIEAVLAAKAKGEDLTVKRIQDFLDAETEGGERSCISTLTGPVPDPMRFAPPPEPWKYRGTPPRGLPGIRVRPQPTGEGLMARYSIPELLDHTGSSHCVIEASAGTGKTFTLEHLIVDLILQGVPLESILVVTYTRKAALELTGRVRKIIAKLAELPADAVVGEGPWRPLGGEGTALLRKALTGFDAATISTIHSFCRQVLDDAAFEGGHLFQQENASSDDLFDRAFTVMLRTEYGKGQRDLLELALESGSEGLKPLRKLLRDALGEADNLDLPEFRDLGAFLAGFPEDLAQAFIEGRADLHAGFPGGHADIRALLEQILERRAAALASGHPAAFWKDKAWAGTTLPQGLEPFRASGVEGGAARLGEAVAALANFKAVLVAAFLPPLREELRRHKAEAGLYDFDDMINLVVRALESPHGGALVERLRERFQVALIERVPGHQPAAVDHFQQAVPGHRSGAPAVPGRGSQAGHLRFPGRRPAHLPAGPEGGQEEHRPGSPVPQRELPVDPGRRRRLQCDPGEGRRHALLHGTERRPDHDPGGMRQEAAQPDRCPG